MKINKKIWSLALIFMLFVSLFSGSIFPVKAEGEVTLVPSTANGLRVQIYASNWGLSGKWKDTDILGISRTRDGEFDLVRASQGLGQNRDDLKRIRIDGFITPAYTERYEFTTNHNENLKMWINDQLVVNYGIVNDIELDAGIQYKLEVELQNEGFNDLILKWESQSQAPQKIPRGVLNAPIEVQNVPFNALTEIDYNPKSDTDGDGIPDAWERNGYAVQEGVIMPFEPRVHTKKYVTSDIRRSTDGDPYSDFEEVTGIGMDQSVKWPGNDPLVPAYPIIEFVPTSVKIVPSIANENVKSVKIGSGSTEKVSAIESDVTADGGYTKGLFKSKAEVGIKYDRTGAEAKGWVGAYYKLDAAGGMDWNSRDMSGNETKNVTETLDKLSRNEVQETVTSVDFTDYAYLNVNGYYKNRGTATAYNVEPTINVSIADRELLEEDEESGNTVVKTFKVISEQRPKLIGPQLDYPTNGSISLSLTSTADGKVAKPIRLTKKQTDQLSMGYPFRIGGAFTSYKTFGSTDEGNRWSSYEHAIDEVCAKVTLTLPKAPSIERKIYAGDQNNRMNLVSAIERLFKGKINEEGNLVVDGEEINTSSASDWGVRVSVRNQSQFTQIQSRIASGNFRYEDLILTPGMDIEIFKKDNAAEANIITAYYNPIDMKIYAAVIRGAEPIKSVKAKIKTDREFEITLQKKGDSNTEFISSEEVPNISATYNSRLVVQSEGGVTTERKIFVDDEYLKINAMQGLNYQQFPSNFNKKPFTSKSDRDAVKNYVQRHTENKYYTVTIGENIRRNFEKRQLHQSITIGSNKIYNQAEIQMHRANERNHGTSIHEGNPGVYKLYVKNRSTYGSSHDWFSENQIRSIKVPWGGGAKSMNLMPGSRSYKTNSNYQYYELRHYSTYNNKIALKIKTNTSDGDWRSHGVVDHFVNGSYKVKDFGNYYEFMKGLKNKRTVFGLIKDADFYDVTPPAEHTQFAIVTREDLLAYLNSNDGFWNTNTLAIEGMFTEDSNGKVFIPSMGNYTSVGDGQGEISPAFDQDADSVMLNVRKNGRDSGYVTLGNSTMAMNTGKSSGIHGDLAIVDLKENGRINKKIQGGKSVDVQVLGYFIDKSNLRVGQKYWQYWIPSNRIRTSIYPTMERSTAPYDGPSMEEALGQMPVADGTNRIMVSWEDLEVNGYPVKPKGYIVRVDQKGVGTKQFDLNINGVSNRMDLGHKLHSDRNPGSRYNPVNHTGYIFVPASNENPFALDMRLNVDTPTSEGVQGQVNIEVVGFFYENLY